MNTVQLQGLGQQSRLTMIPLMQFRLGKNRGYPLFWQVFKLLDIYNLGIHLVGMSRNLLTSAQL